jgi:hypothetical protein
MTSSIPRGPSGLLSQLQPQGYVALSRGQTEATTRKNPVEGEGKGNQGLYSPQNFISGQEGQGLQQIKEMACHSIQFHPGSLGNGELRGREYNHPTNEETEAPQTEVVDA